ncbi:DNA alkylation repair protein [uncultured Shewanella sp.]|uniref:DNA alkylation repair protein n=1 Tax=uncultured Shewanella sp. TaxID=173975 RepID=UPI00261E9319|nr:DNA alkylation repair protein [uncultured Shewanella sp.]
MNEKRKGATRVADVPADILSQLNLGTIEAATLAENLATDLPQLMGHVFPKLLDKKVCIEPKLGITKKMAMIATLIEENYGDEKLAFMSQHNADLVRGWGAYCVAQKRDVALSDRILQMQVFADDPHFGVREWAWLSLRLHVVKAPLEAIEYLLPWARDSSANIRRFAIEVMRPRGVWSAHIGLLKKEPQHAETLLNSVNADPSKYVQDAVGNWLNDAYKTAPQWVEQCCQQWLEQSDSPATGYIVKRGLRSVG